MPAAFYRARARAPLHPLLASQYFHRFFIILDMMHLVDCKGLAAIVYGSLLHALVRHPGLGNNQSLRLLRINELKDA
eukprot:3800325-Pyramimonas_sp.AAC.1